MTAEGWPPALGRAYDAATHKWISLDPVDPDEPDIPGLEPPPVVLLPNGQDIRPFYNSICRFITVGPDSECWAWYDSAGELVTMWESPPQASAKGHRRKGQNILYQDGHVEFHPLGPNETRFPLSPYSHEWLKSQVPAPSGDPNDPWGDCP